MRVRVSKPRFGTAAAFVMAVVTFAIIMATMPPSELPRPAFMPRRARRDSRHQRPWSGSIGVRRRTGMPT